MSGVAPVMAAPRLPWAMYKPLAAISQDWLVPGIGNVPESTVAVMRPNHAFIEAYLVGLNHEMARELLWRGFPTDQRGTVFDRFWSESAAEIAPIHGWTRALGENQAGARQAQLVLLVKGELVRSFPEASVFLQRATAGPDGARRPDPALGGASTLLPIFGGRLDPDIRFVGFDITADRASGGASAPPGDEFGYYFVLQEQPGDLRFGPPAGAPEGGFETPQSQTAPQADATAKAYLRPAFRLYVHADDLIG
jgi:hypothetical protein